MKSPYFVMLKHPGGEYILPLVDDCNELMQYPSEKEAIEAAQNSWLGSEIGYSVFNFEEGL